MSKPLHVLIVEDSEDDTLLVLRELRRGGFDPTHERVEIADALSAALGKKTWDVILCDYRLPKFSAPGALELVKEAGVDLPFIIVSGAIGEEKAAGLMRAGAHDLIRKDNLARLVPAIEREVSEAGIRRDRDRAQETVRYQTYHDLLTGLPNRPLFLDRLSSAIAIARRIRQMLSVLLIDLDRFKVVNDTLGYPAGDKVIKEVAKRLTATLREDDTVARMGADQFIVLLPIVKKAGDAATVVGKILATLEPETRIDGHELHLTASIGVSLYPLDGSDAGTLLKNADTALHKAKGRGGACYEFFARDMNVALSERLALEGELRKAVELDQFIVHYQPVVDAATGEIFGAEVLVRWKHPEKGLVSPAKFISVAEETGLIVPLGEWVLRSACAQARAWHDKGLTRIPLAVNLSARQLKDPGFLETVKRVLDETGLEPTRLKLELTESMVMEDVPEVVTLLRRLHEAGIGLSIDDFGTGYSSLSELQRFPIETLKIDRAFVHDMASNPKNAAVVQAIIAMAHSLNLKAIAEGVETEEQRTFLRAYQCDGIQGYLYHRPLPPSELTALLKARAFPARGGARPARRRRL